MSTILLLRIVLGLSQKDALSQTQLSMVRASQQLLSSSQPLLKPSQLPPRPPSPCQLPLRPSQLRPRPFLPPSFVTVIVPYRAVASKNQTNMIFNLVKDELHLHSGYYCYLYSAEDRSEQKKSKQHRAQKPKKQTRGNLIKKQHQRSQFLNPNQAPTTNDAIIKGKSYAEEEKQRNVPHLSEDIAKSSEG